MILRMLAQDHPREDLQESANFGATERALRPLDFIITQDMFLNETARRFGSLFLPATSSFEKDGAFMNAERRVQRIRKAIEPVGDSTPDWKIICAIAVAMPSGGPTALWLCITPNQNYTAREAGRVVCNLSRRRHVFESCNDSASGSLREEP